MNTYEVGSIEVINCKKCNKETKHIYTKHRTHGSYGNQTDIFWKCSICDNRIYTYF